MFNGRDGEWRARLENSGKRRLFLAVTGLARGQTEAADVHYLFAPLKHARLDYMVQKAVEMGAGRLVPVMTRHAQVGRVNLDRMRANAIEAAEQCGILTLPEIQEPAPFDRVLASRDATRLLVFCDEDAEVRDPVAALAAQRKAGRTRRPVDVLVGPEGGFADDERKALAALPNVLRLSLGPRILRADTAAVAALAWSRRCSAIGAEPRHALRIALSASAVWRRNRTRNRVIQRPPSQPSCPGLTRASIEKRLVDSKGWIAGSSPAMTRCACSITR